ncbi:MAG: AAA family ATPase [Candidatus Sericytochromatia bacterium]
MKTKTVEELLKVSKTTLLQRIKNYNLDIPKTQSGQNIFKWEHIIKLTFLEKYSYINNLNCKVMTISQNKGGVGKTTSVINLGTGLSYIGKTLLIDLDSQGNLSQAFDLYLTNDQKSVSDVFDDPDNFEIAVIKINPNLHILPNSLKFEKWKRTNRNDTKSPFILKKILKNIKNNYNFILIDTPPALDFALHIALYASQFCLIPIEPHPFALDGISNIIEEIEYIGSNDAIADFNLKILGVFINLFEKNTLNEQIAETVKENFNTFETKIKKAVAVQQSQALKKAIFEHDEASQVSYDYYNLLFEILERLIGEG